MDFLKIKNLIKQNKDKFVFVENGEPELVVMPFSEYEKLVSRSKDFSVLEAKGHDEHVPSYLDLFKAKQDGPAQTGRPRDILEIPTDSLEFSGRQYRALTVGESLGLSLRLEDIRPEDLPI